MNSSQGSQCRQLLLNWYDAADKNYDTTKRIELYKATEEKKWKYDGSDKNLWNEIQQIFIEKQKDQSNEKLSQWILSNTLVVDKKNIGAYDVFYNFIQSICDSSLSMYGPMSKIKFEEFGFKTMNSSSFSETLGRDIEGYLASFLMNRDLISMSLTCSSHREKCKNLLIKRLNSGDITLSGIRINSWEQASDFFGDLRFSLTRLDLSQYKNLQDADIANLWKYFPNIESVSLYDAKIQNLTCFANWNINTLELVSCLGLNDFCFLDNFPFLTSLDLRGCSGIQSVILEECSHLESLNISDCTGLQNCDFLINCPDLKCLNLKGCSRITDFSNIAHCRQLAHLNLEKCSVLNLTFLDSLPFLTHLNLNSCLLRFAVFGKSPSLQTLELRYCHDISFLENFPSLTHLDLNFSREVQDLSVLEKCPLLIDLQLMNCAAVKNFDFLGNCPSLTNLDLTNCNVFLVKQSNNSYYKQTLDLYSFANPPPLKKLKVTSPRMIDYFVVRELKNRGVDIQHYSYV